MPAGAPSGIWQAAGRYNCSLLRLVDALFAQVNPIPLKKAMCFAGWEAGPCRLPLTEPSEQVKRLLWKEMKLLGMPMLEEGVKGDE